MKSDFLNDEFTFKEFILESNLDGLKRIKKHSKEVCNLMFENKKKEKELLLCIDEIFSNCILHAYENKSGIVRVKFCICNKYLKVNVKDYGIGIPKKYIKEKPRLYNNLLAESGKGLFIVNNICDKLIINRNKNSGTEVTIYFEMGVF